MTANHATATRTLHYSVDPALRAYFAWIDRHGLMFLTENYDLFAAGYRAQKDDDEEYRQRADTAVRCCESGHAPAYRRGRVAGQRDIGRAAARSYRLGRHHGTLTALCAVVGLGMAALWLGRGR